MQPESEHNRPNENNGTQTPAVTGVAWPALDRRKQPAEPGGVPQGVYTLRSLIEVLSRRRYPLAATFLLLFGAACIVTLLIPRRYEAEAKLMVRRARQDAPVTVDRAASSNVPAEMTEAELNAEVELLQSRDLLEQVAEACRLVQQKPQEEHNETLARGVREMEKGLKVATVNKTNLISVQFRAAEPGVAAEVVNRLVQGYLRKHVAVHRAPNTAVFFKSQADNFGKELNEAQHRLAGFRSKDGVSSLPDEKASALKRAADLEASIEETDSSIHDAENRARLLREQRAALPVTIETGSRMARSVGLIERLKGQLVELENKRTELLTKYEPSYRLVREVEQQIHDTRAALEKEQAPAVVDRTNAPNPLRQSIEGDLLRTEATIAGLRARRASLTEDLDRSRARLAKLDTLAGEHDDIQRRLRVAEENYLLYQKKEEESRMEEALDQQRILNVAIVEKAAIPADPAPRHRRVILMIGLLLASFGAVAAAFLADYFCLPPAIKKTGMPPVITRALMTEPAPAGLEPAYAANDERPEEPPQQPTRTVTNADRAAFVATGREALARKQKPDVTLRAERTSCMRDRMPEQEQPEGGTGAGGSHPARQPLAPLRPAVSAAPRKPAGVLSGYGGGSARRLFDV